MRSRIATGRLRCCGDNRVFSIAQCGTLTWPNLADSQGTVCKILGQEEVKPHKVLHCLGQRDP
jgi:hypothetical protein